MFKFLETSKPVLGLAAAAVILSCSAAKADTISFSFSNDPSWGNVAGTVTGELVGLPHDGTGPATAVIITDYPAALVQFGSYPTPFDALAWSGTVGENSFTLVNGVITGGSFYITNANGVEDQLFVNSTCCGGGTNYLDIGSNNSLDVWNQSGIGEGGVTFGEGVANAPEPSSMLLLVGGGVALLIRRRRVGTART